MKAIVVHEFGGPDVLKLEEVPDLVPGPGRSWSRVRAIGVNPVETYIRKGIYGPKTFPYTPGSDASGVVETVGAAVTRFRPGDRVYTGGTISGAYAQKVLCRESKVYGLPANITFQQGAAMHVPYATAYRALYRPRTGGRRRDGSGPRRQRRSRRRRRPDCASGRSDRLRHRRERRRPSDGPRSRAPTMCWTMKLTITSNAASN